MPRRQAFDAGSLYVHFQPSMARAFPATADIPAAMQALVDRLARPVEMTIGERLEALRQLFADEGSAIWTLATN